MQIIIFVAAAVVFGACAYYIKTHPASPADKQLEAVEDVSEKVIETDLGLPKGSMDLNKNGK